jgi:voltage-gated potassium channel
MHPQLKTLIIAVGLFVLSLILGILGFIVIENYGIIDAFYMSVITLSTVGYGEVHTLSEAGRVFTAVYIIVNLGIFAYVVSVISTYLFEGKLKNVLDNFMKDRTISKLNDHVIVCGFGRNGSQACEELIHEGRNFIVIDKDPEALKDIENKEKYQVIVADATTDKTLKLAGIERAKEIIITTPSDASNVFITLTARELKPDIMIIARASEMESESKLYRAGADKVILPDYLGGMFMAQMVTNPVVIEFLDLLTGRSHDREKYKLVSVGYQELKKRFRDKTLKELKIQKLTGGTVIAVKDNIKGMIPNPPPDTFIGIEDTMIILCEEKTAEQVLETLIEK